MPTRPREGGPTRTPHNGRFRTQPAGTAGRASAAPTACRRRVAGDPAGVRRRRKTMRCLEDKTSWQEGSVSDGTNDESSGDRPDTEVDGSCERWDIAKRGIVVIGPGRLECLVRPDLGAKFGSDLDLALRLWSQCKVKI